MVIFEFELKWQKFMAVEWRISVRIWSNSFFLGHCGDMRSEDPSAVLGTLKK